VEVKGQADDEWRLVDTVAVAKGFAAEKDVWAALPSTPA